MVHRGTVVYGHEERQRSKMREMWFTLMGPMGIRRSRDFHLTRADSLCQRTPKECTVSGLIQSRSVVIADDDADMRMLVEISARRAGLQLAAAATDGDEAWHAINRHRPDLIVLDVSMPGMSGLDVCRLVRSTPTLAHVPVLLLSAGVSGPAREAGNDAGADDFMPKPFSPKLLTERLLVLSTGRPSFR